MTTLGSGTLGSGTLGNPGGSSTTGGVRRNNKGNSGTFARKSGRIDWVVDIHGSGELIASSSLSLDITLVPAGAASALVVELAGRPSLQTAGHVGYVTTTTAELAMCASTDMRIEPAVALRQITDPPELWDLLDLTELTP